MMEADLDLSIDAIIKACKGNVKALPTFMVHNNNVWPWVGSVKLDSQNRIHMRRNTFEHVVASHLPVKPGIWHRMDVQEFSLELQAHHLGGSEALAVDVGHTHSRPLILADAQGRTKDDIDHGETLRKGSGVTQSDLDDARNEIGGKGRGVRSKVVD